MQASGLSTPVLATNFLSFSFFEPDIFIATLLSK